MAQEMMASKSFTQMRPFNLVKRDDQTPSVSILEVEVVKSTNPMDRDSLLTEGVYEVIEFLITNSRNHGRRSILDVRLAENPAPASLPGAYAFVEAVRGLVQSFTLESGPDAPACNIVVSTLDQHQAREATLAYLTSKGGGFSWGSTYDLRKG